MNRVGLTASLLEREAIRYTPAGVPIVGLKLSHRSVQREAGTDRTVEMEISAIAADRMALRIDRIALGTGLKLEGFLAPRRRNVKALVLHVTDFELDPTVERTA
ncbi:MAG TPA: primosomal replication protein N [Burkholderiaceae bacterium]|nr:primosomal replication protein N [Burkholderiaceae bacterium]